MKKQGRSPGHTSTVRVLYFPASEPTSPVEGADDALAEAIRKSWTQRGLPAEKQEAATQPDRSAASD